MDNEELMGAFNLHSIKIHKHSEVTKTCPTYFINFLIKFNSKELKKRSKCLKAVDIKTIIKNSKKVKKVLIW